MVYTGDVKTAYPKINGRAFDSLRRREFDALRKQFKHEIDRAMRSNSKQPWPKLLETVAWNCAFLAVTR